jgi:hypothetical protein
LQTIGTHFAGAVCFIAECGRGKLQRLRFFLIARGKTTNAQ